MTANTTVPMTPNAAHAYDLAEKPPTNSTPIRGSSSEGSMRTGSMSSTLGLSRRGAPGGGGGGSWGGGGGRGADGGGGGGGWVTWHRP
ncbi:hypothetical protein GCM10010176_009160 [Nonomuraea spiralis]|nr:hypothetical protein GCM10010176_009160 [Nonomuraea spiralis]